MEDQPHNTLRQATLNDVPLLVEHAYNLFKQSTYNYVSWDEAKAREMIEKAVIEGGKDFLVLLSYDKEDIVGGVMAYAFEPLFSKERIAVESYLWLDEDYRSSRRGQELLEAYEYWCKLVDVKIAQVGLLASADQRMAKFYERRGYKIGETVYYKELQ